MNVVTLMGRLSKDPELRYSPQGMANTRITLAVDRGYNQQKRQEAEAQNQPTADFINCVAFGRTAELIANYFNKGNRIGLVGRIQTGSYNKQDGTRVYTTDVLVSSVEFIESRSTNNQGNNNQNTNYARRPQTQNNNYQNNNYARRPQNQEEATFFPINNEDIPF